MDVDQDLIRLEPLFPYLDVGPWQIGFYTLHMFGLMIILGAVVGIYFYYRRARQLHLPANHADGMLGWSVATALIVSHIFYFVFYHEGPLTFDSWTLLNVFAGMSSFGGFLGLLAASVLYARIKRLSWCLYADTLLWGAVHGWLLARIGCAFAHDHPGRFTDAWLAMRWPAGHPDQWLNVHGLPGRHDLGLDEALLTALILVLLYATNRRGRRFAGFNVALAFCVYAPGRFLLDFLRVNDPTYLGLTLAQYGSVAMLLLGIALFIYYPRKA